MNFLKYSIVLVILFATYVSLMGHVFQTASAQSASIDLITDGSGFAVVELFTSEGCSSCPPAEAHLNDLSYFSKNNPNVALYPLAFHVDYWDYLGWKDPFAQEKFTARQRNYSKRMGRNNVYTPQMIVNGTDQFVGSHRHKGVPIINAALSAENITAPNLKIESLTKSDGKIKISYTLSGAFKPQSAIVIAIVENDLKTQVKRGENRGKSLIHQNVVRHLEMHKASSNDKITLDYKADRPLSIIAFIQNRQSLEIIAATKKDI